MKFRILNVTDGTSEEKALFEAAAEVRGNTYSPYSQFPVGAALLDEAGNIYTGCNTESGSYGLTNCAERVAIGNMNSANKEKPKIRAMCVVLEGGEQPGGSCCGACRQVIWEFCGNDESVVILLAGPNGNIRATTIGELLPDPFILKQ